MVRSSLRDRGGAKIAPLVAGQYLHCLYQSTGYRALPTFFYDDLNQLVHPFGIANNFHDESVVIHLALSTVRFPDIESSLNYRGFVYQ